MACVFACVLFANCIDIIADIPPDSVVKLLEEFRHATQRLKEGVVPSDVDSSAMDKGTLKTTVQKALALTKMRMPGQKSMRFSDQIMQKVMERREEKAKERLSLATHTEEGGTQTDSDIENAFLADSKPNTPEQSLFAQYVNLSYRTLGHHAFGYLDLGYHARAVTLCALRVISK